MSRFGPRDGGLSNEDVAMMLGPLPLQHASVILKEGEEVSVPSGEVWRVRATTEQNSATLFIDNEGVASFFGGTDKGVGTTGGTVVVAEGGETLKFEDSSGSGRGGSLTGYDVSDKLSGADIVRQKIEDESPSVTVPSGEMWHVWPAPANEVSNATGLVSDGEWDQFHSISTDDDLVAAFGRRPIVLSDGDDIGVEDDGTPVMLNGFRRDL